MKTWNSIQNELKDLNSSLSSEKLPEAYAVPEGYFENFAQTVLQKIKSENATASEELASLSPLLAGLSKKMPFSVPEGYFTDISTQLSGITAEETVPEILQTIGKSMPYQVPAGYFEELPNIILKKVRPAQPAKVISMTSRWKQYAVAAMIAGVVIVSSVFFFGNRDNGTAPSVQSEQWLANKLQNVSNQELEEFITTSDLSRTAIAHNTTSNSEVRPQLNDVPDDELEKFLNEIPVDEHSILN